MIHYEWEQKKQIYIPKVLGYWNDQKQNISIFGDFDFWEDGLDILFPIPLVKYN